MGMDKAFGKVLSGFPLGHTRQLHVTCPPLNANSQWLIRFVVKQHVCSFGMKNAKRYKIERIGKLSV
jgi:hypothetical protein